MPAKPALPTGPWVYYGVNGDGMGHASRALAVIPELLAAGYRVRVFSHGAALRRLQDAWPDTPCHAIPGLRFAYRQNGVDWLRTTARILALMPRGPGAWRLLRRLADADRPLAAVSDYEPVVAHAAARLRLPLVALDHQQFLTELRLDQAADASRARHLRAVRLSNRMTYSRPALRVVSNFFAAPFAAPGDPAERLLVGPMLRDAERQARPSAGEHVLVYQTSVSMHWLGDILARLPGEKRVYGADLPAAPDITLRPFDRDGFLHDLATCRFAVINGGYTTLCEALYLGKPLLCLPIRGQAEQEVNAHYVQALGMGRSFTPAPGERPDLAPFLASLDSCRDAIRRHLLPPGTDHAVDSLRAFLARHAATRG